MSTMRYIREGSEFICADPGCGMTFENIRYITQHIEARHSEKKYVCDEPGCDRRFALPLHLGRHKSTIHATPEQKARKKQAAQITITRIDEPEPTPEPAPRLRRKTDLVDVLVHEWRRMMRVASQVEDLLRRITEERDAAAHLLQDQAQEIERLQERLRTEGKFVDSKVYDRARASKGHLFVPLAERLSEEEIALLTALKATLPKTTK